MFSIVIRNKNEAKSLENILRLLTTVYANDYQEIILVDNNSTDDSVAIAEKYNCRIVTIDRFSYGRAINYGIAAAQSKYILLLSAHAIPVGNSFFKNALQAFQHNEKVAAIRFINNFDNLNRAFKNDFKIKEDEALTAGLMAACSGVNKDVWEQFKFDEDLIANEDKHWSKLVISNGFEVLDFNETYFYFMKRNAKGMRKRYKIETLESLRMHNKKGTPPLRILLSFFKKVFYTNTVNYFKTLWNDIAIMKIKFEIYRKT